MAKLNYLEQKRWATELRSIRKLSPQNHFKPVWLKCKDVFSLELRRTKKRGRSAAFSLTAYLSPYRMDADKRGLETCFYFIRVHQCLPVVLYFSMYKKDVQESF